MAIIPADEKVFMVDKRTNTTYGGSKALQDMQQWYTMQDVSDSIQPYKVFTALLTQSGSDSTESFIDSGDLSIGTTYYISANDGLLADFTNVGAPNNEMGTYFIATGTTPNSWGTFSELGYVASAPIATVLENTIGNVWFTYNGVGSYQIPFDACALIGLTLSNSTAFINNNSFSNKIVLTIFDDGDGPLVQIYTRFDDNTDGDGILQNTPIEIRIYN